MTEFTAWNEPDNAGQPTSQNRAGSDGAPAAAKFWMTFRDICKNRTPKCTVAAGDFVDGKELSRSNGAYFKSYRASLTGIQPRVWAFHPYVAANTSDDKLFDGFIGNVLGKTASPPEIWITEAGGIRSSNSFQYDSRTEADATRGANRLLTTLVNKNARITRMYYYSLHGAYVQPGTGGVAFDSGLLKPSTKDSNGKPVTPETKRPQFDDFKAMINPTPSPVP